MPNDSLKRLLDRIEKLQSEESASAEPKTNNFKIGSFYNRAIDFFSCIISSTIIGYIIDHFAGYRFAFTIVFFFLGIITGIYNIVKQSR